MLLHAPKYQFTAPGSLGTELDIIIPLLLVDGKHFYGLMQMFVPKPLNGLFIVVVFLKPRHSMPIAIAGKKTCLSDRFRVELAAEFSSSQMWC